MSSKDLRTCSACSLSDPHVPTTGPVDWNSWSFKPSKPGLRYSKRPPPALVRPWLYENHTFDETCWSSQQVQIQLSHFSYHLANSEAPRSLLRSSASARTGRGSHRSTPLPPLQLFSSRVRARRPRGRSQRPHLKSGAGVDERRSRVFGRCRERKWRRST